MLVVKVFRRIFQIIISFFDRDFVPFLRRTRIVYVQQAITSIERLISDARHRIRYCYARQVAAIIERTFI